MSPYGWRVEDDLGNCSAQPVHCQLVTDVSEIGSSLNVSLQLSTSWHREVLVGGIGILIVTVNTIIQSVLTQVHDEGSLTLK